jgi:hypothetical protein
LGQVELDIADLDTALLGVVQDLVVKVGVVEEGLGGNAADVQAGTTEGSALLDTCGLARYSVSISRWRDGPNWRSESPGLKFSHLETFLASLDGSNVTGDTATDDNKVMVTCREGGD